MPNFLSTAKAMSRNARLSMPRSLIAWLSGVMVRAVDVGGLGDDVGDGVERGHRALLEWQRKERKAVLY